MVASASVCLRRLGDGRSGEVRFGRFLANAKVTVSALIEGWSQGTSAAVQGRHVLALQDTTEVHFTTTAERRRGLGLAGKGNVHGLLVHPVLVIDADSRVCHGLAGGSAWTRDGVVESPHRERLIEDKETACWLDAAEESKTMLSAASRVTMVADREADFYIAWARLPAPGFDLLIRSGRDRRLAGGGMMYDASASWEEVERRSIKLRKRAGRKARQATLALRYGEVCIRRPDSVIDEGLADSVTLRLVEVREIDPPEGVKPLHWRLLTTHRVSDAARAWEIIDWYAQRWHIEQLFRTMKSHGLGIEESQVADAERLLKLSAIATRAACLIMQLVQARDGAGDQRARDIFPPDQIAALKALAPTLEGATLKQHNPHPSSSLAWAAWMIARLGGWNGYKSSRPPGPITFRNGLKRFNAIALGFKLKKDMCIP